MRILHIIPSVAACRGGASKAALDMVSALRAQHVDVEIACTNDNGSAELDVALNQLVQYQGVPVRFFKRFSPPFNAVREFAYSGSFRVWLRANIENYDIIHVHALFSFCSTYSMRLARKRGVKYIAHPIGSLEAWSLNQGRIKKSVFLNLFEKRNLRSAARVHFTAQSEATQAKRIVPNLTALTIPLGLAVPALQDNPRKKITDRWGLANDIPIILYLGRLHQKKGIELLLSALSQIHLEDANKRLFNLVIAGDGEPSYKIALESQIAEAGLSERCQLVGYVEGDTKLLLLQGADLFALTSFSENFGIAVLEALANGTAALVSKDVALSQQVDEHAIGFVCETEVSSIKAALLKALSSEVELDEIGVQAREYALEHHRWPSLAAKLQHAYQQIITE